VSRLAGKEQAESPEAGFGGFFSSIQDKTALLPDYEFKTGGIEQEKNGKWPAVDPSNSASGLIGGVMTLAMALLIGVALKKRKKRGRE
jgi:cobalt/nickel transport system permease protein